MYLYAHTPQNLILASNLIGRQYAQSLMWLPLARPRKYWNLAIVLSRSVYYSRIIFFFKHWKIIFLLVTMMQWLFPLRSTVSVYSTRSPLTSRSWWSHTRTSCGWRSSDRTRMTSRGSVKLSRQIIVQIIVLKGRACGGSIVTMPCIQLCVYRSTITASISIMIYLSFSDNYTSL